MSEWKEIEFAQCLGMATNPNNPGRKTARLLKNVQTHLKPGSIKLRPGYVEKYAAPTHSTINDPEDLNFDMCFDRQADSAGEELTIQIQKATVEAIDDTGSPVVADTMEMLIFWLRPNWSGSVWTNVWQWLNETIITKVTTASDATYQNMIIIFGGTTQGIAADELVGYVIYNKTQDQYARIITNKAVDATHTRINHTVFNSDWAVDDVIIISRNWLPIDAHQELFDNAELEDCTFHRQLHDLRIGFGGQENRPGLAIGYRNKYLMIEEIDFTSVHADLTAAAIEAFAGIDDVILDTHILDLQGAYGFTLTQVGGTLPADTYYFRLVGVMDGYAKHMVFDESVTLDGTKDLEIYPWIDLARMNPRLTDLELYKSTDGITFYKIKDYPIRTDAFNSGLWKIDEDGRLYYGSGELHNEANAVNIANESNSVGSWAQYETELGWLSIEGSGDGGSSYSFKFGILGLIKVAADYRGGIIFPIPGLKAFKSYQLSVSLRSEGVGGTTLYAFFVGASLSKIGRPQTEITVADNVFATYTPTVETGENEEEPAYLVIASAGPFADNRFYADLVSLIEDGFIEFDDTTEDGMEMATALGHNPTYNLVKGWDQAIKFSGRAYYLNPWVDKRYDNFLLVSHLNSDAAYMYDIASFSNYRELELFDSNKAIGMALLPTYELLILKDFSIAAIDPDTGIPREPVFGISCTSRVSIANINGIIYWCGEEDIYMLNIGKGFWAQPMLEDSIRDLYLALENKNRIFGIRDLFNVYKIRAYDPTNKTEYAFSKNGPVTEKKALYPQVYRIDRWNDLVFLNVGAIYASTAVDDDGIYDPKLIEVE